jgi:hypothetical protein
LPYRTLDDTREYGPIFPAAFAAFGAGCAGSAGVPVLAVRGQGPWIGESFTLELNGLPIGTTAFVFLGISKTVWNTIPLPLGLGVIGMGSCTLFASGELVLPAVRSASAATLTLAVPDDASLLGGAFFAQGFVTDPPANPFGATVSNAAEVRVGGK